MEWDGMGAQMDHLEGEGWRGMGAQTLTIDAWFEGATPCPLKGWEGRIYVACFLYQPKVS